MKPSRIAQLMLIPLAYGLYRIPVTAQGSLLFVPKHTNVLLALVGCLIITIGVCIGLVVVIVFAFALFGAFDNDKKENKMKAKEFYAKLFELMPQAVIDTDFTGQIIIYTNLKEVGREENGQPKLVESLDEDEQP